MTNNTLVLVKGCSGAGKSARVEYLIEQLSIMGGSQPLLYNNKQVGILFSSDELGGTYAILGRKQQKNNCWQGIDAVTKHFGSSDNITKFVVEFLSLNNDTTLIIEGAGTTASWRWRPEYLTSINKDNIFSVCKTIYYQFSLDEYDSYSQRVFSRTGRYPLSQAMWKKNKGFLNEFRKTLLELQNLTFEDRIKFMVAEFSHKEPVTHFFDILFSSTSK